LIKAIQINPFEADFYIEMARIYQSRRDLKNAAAILESGLRANPLNFDLLSSLGLLYYQQGIYEKSEEYLHQAAAIKPHNENVKRLLSTLLNANIIHANSEVDLVTDEV
jgi:tetratricopeptide (TPR) repeat protein